MSESDWKMPSLESAQWRRDLEQAQEQLSQFQKQRSPAPPPMTSQMWERRVAPTTKETIRGQAEVEAAQKRLWDYINSLPPEQREKAIEYQRGLEKEAAETEGGMMAIIPKRVSHLSMSLVETLGDLHEAVTEKVAQQVIEKARK